MADYVFAVKLFDNEIRDDNERYSTDCLKKLAELFVGQPGYVDGRYVAKITSAAVVEELDKSTRAGDIYCWVKAEVAIEITYENANLISKISRGICRELRTACTVMRRTCSICGKEIANCEHIQGKIYDSKLCFVILDSPTDVYGWELVDRKTPEDESDTVRAVNKNRGMNKPRICEVLGIEPGESFYIQGFDGVLFWIMDDGTFTTQPNNARGSSAALLRTLDHPDRIIRKPRFTEQEAKDAKDLSRCLRDASKVTRYSNDVVWVLDPSGKELARVKDGMFPSILQGMEYTLDEIVKST